ncbi:MAG: hypothetical protein H0V43_00810 [Gemmatimonadales bacterium]|nr:hypothetical protein [Gemmatimonadales bacterium]
MQHFDYFMLRVARSEQPDRLEGQLERLGSGEKLNFESGEQLLGLVAQWQPTSISGRRFP